MPERKFYRVLVGAESGLGDHGRYEWSGPPRRPWMVGPRRSPFFEALKDGAAATVATGFPSDQEMEAVFCDLDREKSLRDFELKWPGWIVSDRARGLLDAIAPGAADFAPLRVQVKKSGVRTDGPLYWYADIVRCELAIDETRSRLNWEGAPPRWYDPVGSKFVFRSDVPADARLFRLERQPDMVVCDEHFALELERARLRGVKLQIL